MAEQIVDAGGLRPDWNYLESLAGVGHKTASVLMAQWYGIPAFPVDTHIHRLAARWGLSKAKNVEQTERDLKALWPKENLEQAASANYLLRQRILPARNHDLTACPICAWAASKKRIREEARL